MQVEIGYLPRTSFNQDRPTELITVQEKLSQEEVQQYVKRLESAWEVACENIKKAQQSMENLANRHQREPNFNVKDSIWITIKNQRIEQPSYKLDYQIVGLYKILEKVRHLYRLDLPQSIRVHLVFSLDKLQKASNNPLLGQHNDLLLPIQVNGEDEWEVDEILVSKIKQGSLYYQTSQKGYNSNPTQYSAQNFIGCL